MSKKLKNAFCKYYDEEIYEAIKWEPACFPNLNFENWAACIGIAKAILDTMPDKKNITIEDFVTECSSEVSDKEYWRYINRLKTREYESFSVKTN